MRDVSKGSLFIESTVNFWVSIHSMIKHVAKHIPENFTADFEITSEMSDEILKLLIWLRNSSDDGMTIKDPKIIFLGDILFISPTRAQNFS